MNRLRELRLENGLLQKEVAKSIGVSTASYGFYENGVNKPDPDTLIKLADFFEVSLDYLLCRSDDYGNVICDGELAYNSEERKLVESYRELNASGRHLVNETIKTLLATSAGSEQKQNKF